MPPPKLVAPMIRNVQKIEPSETRGGAPLDSLMVTGHRLPQAVDDPGLGDAEREPVASRLLEAGVERIRALARLGVHIRVTLELALVGELADQRGADDPGPPERHGGLRHEPVAEV